MIIQVPQCLVDSDPRRIWFLLICIIFESITYRRQKSKQTGTGYVSASKPILAWNREPLITNDLLTNKQFCNITNGSMTVRLWVYLFLFMSFSVYYPHVSLAENTWREDTSNWPLFQILRSSKTINRILKLIFLTITVRSASDQPSSQRSTSPGY